MAVDKLPPSLVGPKGQRRLPGLVHHFIQKASQSCPEMEEFAEHPNTTESLRWWQPCIYLLWYINIYYVSVWLSNILYSATMNKDEHKTAEYYKSVSSLSPCHQRFHWYWREMCSKSSNSMWLAQILPAILCEGQMLTCATLLQRLNAISQILIAMLREHMVLPYNLRAGT